MITLDKQVVTQRCDACKASFTVVRGSVFEEGRPLGVYLAALHGHSAGGRLVHLALAFREEGDAGVPPVAFAVQVVATASEFPHSLVDWAESPWAGESYLGRMLNRVEALASPLKPQVFHIADHVLEDVPEVRSYFGE